MVQGKHQRSHKIGEKGAGGVEAISATNAKKHNAMCMDGFRTNNYIR